jgi:LacI family transcriptional regulator
MGTTIKDIAEQADVSIATVSLVLNNKRGVSEETRKKIRKIAEEMNYSNPLRSPVAATQEGTIRFLKIARHGHTVNRDHNVFISDYIDGIIHAAKELQYKTEITSFRTTPVDQIVETIQFQSDLAGAIVLGTELNREDIVAFQKASVPLVFIDTFLDYVPFDFVDMNNIDMVFKVIEHFLHYGHRELGIARSRIKTRNFSLRDKAFREAMASLGIALDERYVFDVDCTAQGAYEDMARYLEDGAALPSALFCTNDIIAFGVLKALREKGVRVPEDISIVGFDDLPTAALLDPPLTSIAVSKREIGTTAMRRLDARIRDASMPPAKIVIGGGLIERASVARVGEPVLLELQDPDIG